MQYAATTNPYFFCESPRFNSSMECFGGRVYLSELSEIVLTTIKIEAQKVLDVFRQHKRQANGVSSKSDVNAETKKLSARIALLDRRNITLFEDFAEGKTDKDTYLSAVAANDNELREAKIRVEKLNNQLATSVSKKPTNHTTTESVLRQVLSSDEVTGVIISMIDRIIIYDNERIEIQFAFTDTNTTEVQNGQAYN